MVLAVRARDGRTRCFVCSIDSCGVRERIGSYIGEAFEGARRVNAGGEITDSGPLDDVWSPRSDSEASESSVWVAMGEDCDRSVQHLTLVDDALKGRIYFLTEIHQTARVARRVSEAYTRLIE